MILLATARFLSFETPAHAPCLLLQAYLVCLSPSRCSSYCTVMQSVVLEPNTIDWPRRTLDRDACPSLTTPEQKTKPSRGEYGIKARMKIEK